MKLFCLLAIVLVAVGISMAEFTPEQARDARVKLLENCRSTVEGVTDDDVRNAAGFNIPKTRSGKCLAACVQKATKLIVDGTVSKEGWRKMAARGCEGNEKGFDKRIEAFSECTSVTDDDPCELTHKVIECMHNAATKHGIDVLECPTV